MTVTFFFFFGFDLIIFNNFILFYKINIFFNLNKNLNWFKHLKFSKSFNKYIKFRLSFLS